MSLFVASTHLILIHMSENGSWECPTKERGASSSPWVNRLSGQSALRVIERGKNGETPLSELIGLRA
jgi:hypothetical protein